MCRGDIYLVTDTTNDKKYVGQTRQGLRVRWREHASKSRTDRTNNRFHNAIRKRGEAAFSRRVIDVARSQDELDAKEQLYILLLDTTNPDRGYNCADGGDVRHMTAATRAKISASLRGRKASDSTRQLMSDRLRQRWAKGGEQLRQKQSEETRGRNTGRVVSDETRRRNSCANRGHVTSEVTRQKLVAARKVTWQDPKYRERMITERLSRPRASNGRFMGQTSIAMGGAL
jgi:group I intron endonuclease